MDSLTLIEAYLSTNDATGVIFRALDESSVGQLKKQKPWLVPLVGVLRSKFRMDPKYIPWAVKSIEVSFSKLFDPVKKRYKKDKEGALADVNDFVGGIDSSQVRKEYIQELADTATKFEEASKANKFDKALKVGLLKNRRVKDIMFWIGTVKTALGSGYALSVLQKVLGRLDTLQTRKDVKSQEADLIYKDNRFTVYSPKTHKASCQLGAGTKWCISSRSDSYFNQYKEQGREFAFVMDSAGWGDFYKVAVVYDRPRKAFDSFWDAADNNVTNNHVGERFGPDNWNKIKSSILSYMKKLKVTYFRRKGEVWAGDEVIRDMLASGLDRWAYTIATTFTDYRRFKYVDRDILEDTFIFGRVKQHASYTKTGLKGVVVAPTRARNNYSEVKVKWSKDTKSRLVVDWDKILDSYFPITPKPKDPFTGKRRFDPDIEGDIRDQYHGELEEWDRIRKARDEFVKNIINPLIVLEKDETSGTKDVYVYGLTITKKIDPNESVKIYGEPTQ